jgi:hypothetical protein
MADSSFLIAYGRLSCCDLLVARLRVLAVKAAAGRRFVAHKRKRVRSGEWERHCIYFRCGTKVSTSRCYIHHKPSKEKPKIGCC